jgi:molecular chaperone GrpE
MSMEDKIEYVSEDGGDEVRDKIKKVKERLKKSEQGGIKTEQERMESEQKRMKAEQKSEEYLAFAQKAKADFINYKREQEVKISEIIKFANEGLILDILPVLDSFELAMKHLPDDKETGKDNGIEQLNNQLENILKSNGVEKIEAIGEKFNPELHESIEVVEGEESGIVVEEIQKGYKLNNKVIRASKVKIGK